MNDFNDEKSPFFYFIINDPYLCLRIILVTDKETCYVDHGCCNSQIGVHQQLTIHDVHRGADNTIQEVVEHGCWEGAACANLSEKVMVHSRGVEHGCDTAVLLAVQGGEDILPVVNCGPKGP